MIANGTQAWATALIRRLSHRPAFRIYGKAKYESNWQVIDVYATHRRNWNSRWPLWRGHCITLTGNVIAVGWDFAEGLVTELNAHEITLDRPQIVHDGRLAAPDRRRRFAAAPGWFSRAELLAHECGHTAQARRYGFLYWPIGASFTLFREGPHWWQQFENQASETGQFGGIVPGTLHLRLAEL